jgi:2-octaprenyl-6-methoxyphenol hydroxylase
MKLCILGNGLTSLSLAKSLVKNGVFVDIFLNQKNFDINKSRTVGISKKNVDFYNSEVLNIEKFLWNINQIEVYSEKLNNEKVLNFENSDNALFSMIKNFKLQEELLAKLKKNKFINFKKKKFNDKQDLNKYKLIINCDSNNSITK